MNHSLKEVEDRIVKEITSVWWRSGGSKSRAKELLTTYRNEIVKVIEKINPEDFELSVEYATPRDLA